MLGFMDQVQAAWLDATNWNPDNSYVNLTATSRALLDFPTPRGLQLSLSSLSSSKFATSYSLGSVGVVDGSAAYLYSSIPLRVRLQSGEIDLREAIRGYRPTRELRRPDEAWWWEVWRGGRRIDRKDALLYGRLYLPASTLEGLYLRRLSPTQLLRVACVSDSRLKNGGTILLSHQYDTGRTSLETLYSTDSSLLGIRGLYNFGPIPPHPHLASLPTSSTNDNNNTRLSLGTELYYGLANHSFGLSTGLRFLSSSSPSPSSSSMSTSPPPNHPPITTTTPNRTTATLTLAPLTGSLSANYTVTAGPDLALASRLDFNVYSWESDVVLGCEFHRPRDRGVVKARLDQSGTMALAWQGRIKQVLFSLGSSIDLSFKRRDTPFRSVGLELQYSS